MSNSYYNEIWHLSQHELELLAIEDFQRQNQDVETTIAAQGGTDLVVLDESSRKAIVQATTYEFYLKYICIANRLEEVYDKMIQPQKRQLIRNILNACLGRIIELKHDLVNIDLMEFSYNDAVVERLKLTPIDTELRVPRYFLRERRKEIEQRNKTMHDILVKLGWVEENPVVEQITEIEAIRLIQMHERARQGRLRAHFMKEIRMLKEKGKNEEKDKDRNDAGLLAAMKIQKMWRGHTDRRKTRRRKLDEMILIGMVPPPPSVLKARAEKVEKLNEIYERRYATQEAFQQHYESTLELVREEIRTKHGPNMTEDIADEIRAWIKDCYEKTGKLPEFPTEDQGGSLHIFSRPGTESEVSRSSARSSKESRKTKDKSKSPARSGDLNVNENPDEEGGGLQPAQSMCLPDIRAEIERFNEVWREKDESGNMRQSHYYDMIYAEKYDEVEKEFRKVVDDVMRQELELLQTAIGKKAKKNNKKARRSGKKSKKKKEKDLTPDRTTESLYEELVTNGIIRKYPETRLNQFLGDKAITARDGIKPSPGDIRQILTEYCILPLGSEQIHNSCPLIRSILLVGPKGSGKKTLLHAICTEVGAVLFDLTPANIVGKYPGKSGLIMLIHLVLKVSRLLQPAVIYMGDAEKPFMKKIPKTDRTDPKRLKKDLPKLIRNIAPEDRVLFIGTSNLPWEADQKLLQQTYNRFIYIPRPDYGALSHAWKTLLSEYSGGLSNLDCSVMAKISDGYTIGAVNACLKEVLTCKRKLQLRSQPLTHAELINVLCTRDPVYREEEEAYESWWAKTPLGRRRQKLLEIEEEARLEEQALAAKQGNGKKKT
ncbi:dynein regulatory complex protein 11-like [Musca vetustissima]|uniref:dynein regulatory complex protein 11-like n=1 Tax=Musca vetustissima TaxID=27455 RepID=UPI002AB61CFA|nr:dynein regulatory complex protein 11-like [Musca vetustissima]